MTQPKKNLPPMTLKITTDLRRFLRKNRGTCTQCGRKFKPNDLEHVGYGADGTYLYVGDCCVHKMKETVLRHGYQYSTLDTPSRDTIIWRYMDFSKLLHLVASRRLYFCRANLLPDSWEGAVGSMKMKPQWDAYFKEYC